MSGIRAGFKHLMVVMLTLAMVAVFVPVYADDPLPTDDELHLDNFKIYTSNVEMKNGASVKEGQEIEITFDWFINDTENKNTYSTNIPVQYVVPFADYVENNLFTNGVKIGQYKLENKGDYLRLTLMLDDGVLEDNFNMAQGNVYLGGKLSIDANLEKPNNTNETIIFGDKQLNVVYKNPGTMSIDHKQSRITDDGQITYTVTAKYKEIFDGIHFKVALDSNLAYAPDSIVVTDSSSADISSSITNLQVSDTEFSFDAPLVATSKLEEQTFVIKYNCTLKSMPDFSGITTDLLNFKNTASIKYTEDSGDEKTYSDSAILILDKPTISKNGKLVRDASSNLIKDHQLYEVWWTVSLNLDENWAKLIKNVDLSGVVLTDTLGNVDTAVNTQGEYLVSEFPDFYGGDHQTVSPPNDITTTSAGDEYGLYKRNGYKLFSKDIVDALKAKDSSYSSYQYYYDKDVTFAELNDEYEYNLIIKQLFNADGEASNVAQVDFFGILLEDECTIGLSAEGLLAKYPLDTDNVFLDEGDDSDSWRSFINMIDAHGEQYPESDWCVGMQFSKLDNIYKMRNTSSDFVVTFRDTPNSPLKFSSSEAYQKNMIIALYPNGDGEDLDATVKKFKTRCQKRDDFWKYYEEYQTYKASAEYAAGSAADLTYKSTLNTKYNEFKATGNGIYEISLYDYNQAYSANAEISNGEVSFDIKDMPVADYAPQYSKFDITAQGDDYVKSNSTGTNHFNDMETLISDDYRLCVRVNTENPETEHSYSIAYGFYQKFDNSVSVDYKNNSVDSVRSKYTVFNLYGDENAEETQPKITMEKSKKDSLSFNGETYEYAGDFTTGWYLDAEMKNVASTYEISVNDAMTNGAKLVEDSILVFVGNGKTVSDSDTLLSPSDYTVINNNTAFTITLNQNDALWDRFNGGDCLKVYYKATLPESKFFSNASAITFKNTAMGIIDKGDSMVSNSATATLSKTNKKFLTQVALTQDGEIQYKDDGETVKNEPYISRDDGRIWAWYDVTVNPSGIQVNNGENFTVQDTMTAAMVFKEESIEVIGANADEWSYEYDADNHQLRFSVPDGKMLHLKYKVYFDVDTSDVNWMKSENTQNTVKITLDTANVSNAINFSQYSYIVYIGGKIPNIMATGVKNGSLPILLAMMAMFFAMLGYRRTLKGDLK